MITPCCDGDIVRASGRTGLPIVVISPTDDGAICLKGQTVIISCYDGGIVRASGRTGLPIAVISPTDDGAI